MYAWVGCDGNAVTRTEVGKIVITKIAKNTKNCNGPKSVSNSETDKDIVSHSVSEDTSSSLNMFQDDIV